MPNHPDTAARLTTILERIDQLATAQRDPAAMTDAEVARELAVGRATVWRMVSAGHFPSPRKYPGTNCSRWLRAEVLAWLEQLAGDDQPLGQRKNGRGSR